LDAFERKRLSVEKKGGILFVFRDIPGIAPAFNGAVL
jgi:hypothetical protein